MPILVLSMSLLNANELIHENSSYLKQHATNPVNWLPYNDESFECAQKECNLSSSLIDWGF